MAQQNIYDNKIFFEGYKKIRENEINANNLFEIPALFSMMPKLKGKRVLDLGCGTGNVTECLAGAGYDMTGIDMSEDMLNIAMKKRADSGHDILYLCQEMQEFELYGTVRAVVSICDCINYVTEKEDIVQTFRLVNNYLDPEGIFIFDMNTCYKYREILGDNTFAETREDSSFIWENYYDEEDQIEMGCQYCDKKYYFTKNDIGKMIKKLSR